MVCEVTDVVWGVCWHDRNVRELKHFDVVRAVPDRSDPRDIDLVSGAVRSDAGRFVGIGGLQHNAVIALQDRQSDDRGRPTRLVYGVRDHFELTLGKAERSEANDFAGTTCSP